MNVKMILPALTEAKSPFWRPIKYSLFPPLGLATLAAYLDENDQVALQDEHVESLELNDDPDLVVIQVYITSAYRAYEIADHYRAKGAYVCLGGLHVTSLPDEAQRHADTVFIGPGEDTWPTFLRDFRANHPRTKYISQVRTLADLPFPRRDLIKRHLYLVPNSLVVSRGCPHVCDFCYKEAFFEGGKSFYTLTVDRALAEIQSLPGKHLYFLDDHLFGNPHFAKSLFEGMSGMGRLWQAAGTVQSVLKPGLLEEAVRSGLRSLFVGFETLNPQNLVQQYKYMIPGIQSSARNDWPRKPLKPVTGARTSSIIAGKTSSNLHRHIKDEPVSFGISLMRAVGKSSSPCGIGSSGQKESLICSPCWRGSLRDFSYP